MITNRKTRTEYNATPAGYLTPSRASIFRVEEKVSELDELLDELIRELPANTPEKIRHSVRNQLRKILAPHQNNLQSLKQSTEEMEQLVTTLFSEMNRAAGQEENIVSVQSMFAAFAKHAVTAKLNVLLPFLPLLSFASFVAPAAASAYTAISGVPIGASDLCAGEISNCIRAYIVKNGGNWLPKYPLIARIFQAPPNVTGVDPCISQQEVGSMITDLYRGHNDLSANCSFDVTGHSGTASIFSTQTDPVTCNLMKDRGVSLMMHCNEPPTTNWPPLTDSPVDSGDNTNLIPLAIGAGLVITLLVFLCCKRASHQHHHHHHDEHTGLVQHV